MSTKEPRTSTEAASPVPQAGARERLAFLRTTQETASPPGKILIVDDSPIALDTLSEFLEEKGWTVLAAQSGIDALKAASTPDLDLVLSDLNMPDMSGIELFHHIHALDPMLPVIIVSEQGGMSPVLESVHAGVFDFVPKSDYARMLPAAVTRAVAHCRVLRQNQRLAHDLVRTNAGLERRVAEQARMIEEKLRREAALEREASIGPLRREVEIARRIQTSILPKETAVEGLQIAARMIPASEVGGDYYDIRSTADGCWIGIGDVSGHGLAAGLVMLMIQSGTSALVTHDPDALPHQLLPALNRMLLENLRRRMGGDDHATLTMLRFFSDGRLTYAGAHEDIIVCSREGEIRTIPTDGAWLGISADISHGLGTRTLRLADGDIVVLYTDGIPEMRHKHECFGMPRLVAEVERRHTEPVGAILDGIVRAVMDFGGDNLEDDATLLVLRYVPGLVK